MSTVLSMSLLNKNPYAMDSDADGEVAEFIIAKGYLPNEKDLPKTSILKNVGKYLHILLTRVETSK